MDGVSEIPGSSSKCDARGIRLSVLPPHSSKLNAYVQRPHRIHKEEFYDGAGRRRRWSLPSWDGSGATPRSAPTSRLAASAPWTIFCNTIKGWSRLRCLIRGERIQLFDSVRRL